MSFGGAEQRGIDDRTADGRPDWTHGFADGVEKGGAGVLHEMPAIGDLDGAGLGSLRRQGVNRVIWLLVNVDGTVVLEYGLKRLR